MSLTLINLFGVCLFKWPFIYSVIHNSIARFAGGREALGAGPGQCVEHFIIIKEKKHVVEDDGEIILL